MIYGALLAFTIIPNTLFAEDKGLQSATTQIQKIDRQFVTATFNDFAEFNVADKAKERLQLCAKSPADCLGSLQWLKLVSSSPASNNNLQAWWAHFFKMNLYYKKNTLEMVWKGLSQQTGPLRPTHCAALAELITFATETKNTRLVQNILSASPRWSTNNRPCVALPYAALRSFDRKPYNIAQAKSVALFALNFLPKNLAPIAQQTNGMWTLNRALRILISESPHASNLKPLIDQHLKNSNFAETDPLFLNRFVGKVCTLGEVSLDPSQCLKAIEKSRTENPQKLKQATWNHTLGFAIYKDNFKIDQKNHAQIDILAGSTKDDSEENFENWQILMLSAALAHSELEKAKSYASALQKKLQARPFDWTSYDIAILQSRLDRRLGATTEAKQRLDRYLTTLREVYSDPSIPQILLTIELMKISYLTNSRNEYLGYRKTLENLAAPEKLYPQLLVKLAAANSLFSQKSILENEIQKLEARLGKGHAEPADFRSLLKSTTASAKH